MTPLQPIPFDAALDQYEKQADELLKAHRIGHTQLLTSIQEYHPGFHNRAVADIRTLPFSLADAQLTIARFHHFRDWKILTTYVREVRRGQSTTWQFESAIEALVNGDLSKLQLRLRKNPPLVRLRSMRTHGAMLLHYIGANGVEDYRQKSPQNAVDLTELLLDAGAEVDALADTYGKGTTLGLVATSIHPWRAGVQIPLIETLLANGASVHGAPNRWPPLVAALANGRPQAAQTLARHGAPVHSVVAAAGIGRLDLVRTFFDEQGKLKPLAPDVPIWGIPANPQAQLESAFFYACQYGHIDVADFLLQRGILPHAQDNCGQTALHWAVIGGQLATLRWLLDQQFPTETRNVYGGTVLGQAFWNLVNGDPGTNHLLLIQTLLEAGARPEPGTLPWLDAQTSLAAPLRQQLSRLLRQYGATTE